MASNRSAGKPGIRAAASGLMAVSLLAWAVQLPSAPPKSHGTRETPPNVPPPQPFAMPSPAVRTLRNGLKVLVIERRTLPVVTLRLVVKTGAEADPADLPGTAQIVAGLLNEGTSHRTAFQIAEAIDDAGGEVDNSADWDESYLALSVLADHAEMAFDLVADMVIHPAFRPEEVERARTQMVSSLQILKDDPGYLADAVYNELEFSGTAYGHPPDGTVAAAERVTAAALHAFHGRAYRPSNAILAVVGDIASEEAFALAEKYFGDWPEPSATANSQPGVSSPAPSPQVFVIDKPDAVQTEIRVGTIASGRASPDYYALALANQVLGGPAANRLFKSLRTEHGLTYGASSELVCYRPFGTWEAKTSTRTSETIASVKLVLDQIRRLRDFPVSDTELEYSKNFLIGHLALEFESSEGVAAQVLELMVHDLPLDYWNRFPEKVRALTAEDVENAVRRYLNPDRISIVMVGHAAEFAKELKGLGPARVISLPELDLSSPTLKAPRAP